MRAPTKTVLFIQFLLFAAIYLDVPILRPIVGFAYLSVIPGFVLLRFLRVREGSTIDNVLFSVGLSIAFLMFVGLLMNELYPLLGVLRPLSVLPLTITISVLTSGLLLVSHKQNMIRANCIKPRSSVFFRATFFVLPPLLGIIGALYGSIPILLAMILAIAALYAASVLSSGLVPIKLYPLIISAVSTALVFHMSLRSKYLMGYDVHLEYYVFKLTEINGRWHSPGPGSYPSLASMFVAVYQSVLSVTILPAVYSLLLNISEELIFKIIYPLIFCLVPLALYRMYEKQTGKLVALISVLFFVSNHYAFYGVEMLSLARQMTGDLFLVLSMLLIVDKEIALQKRRILFMIFGAALVASHYTLSFIYLFYIVLVFAISRSRASTHRWEAQKTLNGASVLLLIVLTFSWNQYVSSAPSETLIRNTREMYDMFVVDFFNLGARSSHISPPRPSVSPISLANWMLFCIRHLFILVGVVMLMINTKRTAPEYGKIVPEYRIVSISSVVILFLCIVVPNFAPTINFTRFYAITLMFLAPFFSLGGKTVFGWMVKLGTFFSHRMKRGSHRNLEFRLVSVVLIGSLLFEIGFVQHVTGADPSSPSLDMSRMKTSNDLKKKANFYNAYTPEQDVFGAKWLSRKTIGTPKIYADLPSAFHVLTSYGLISRDHIQRLSNRTSLEHGAYIYLRHLNVIDGIIVTVHDEPLNMSDVSSLFENTNKIYSNGGSDIHCKPGS